MASISQLQDSMSVCWAASQGDLHELQRLYAAGYDLSAADYDGRTGIHLASSEGHLDAVKFFLAKGIDDSVKDRWGGTPLDDARRGNFQNLVIFLEEWQKNK
jgi:glutaminase